MKRGIFFLLIFALVVLVIAGTSQGFQGRMAGMGDPYGLVKDESDFLIHPAKIAAGEGVRFYGGYRFLYRDMLDSDTDFKEIWGRSGSRDLSGAEWVHDALVGASFPLGPGRMGLFFTYGDREGDLDGAFFSPTRPTYDLALMSGLDDYALRVIYGIPLDGFKFGGELGVAYRQEISKSIFANALVNWWGPDDYHYLILPCVSPYDSDYWEILARAGFEGMLGPVDLEFSLRGGWIFSGDNTMEYGDTVNTVGLDGDVEGWRIGGDLWVRYPLADDLFLPVLVRVDFHEKTRDGDVSIAGGLLATDTKEQSLDIMVGGGVERGFGAGTRLAAGIYYSYLHHNTDFLFYGTDFVNLLSWDHMNWPDAVEHRGTVALAGEWELSPAVALRMGLSGFFGWASEDQQISYPSQFIIIPSLIDYPLAGTHWGIGASLGATLDMWRFVFEPFVNFEYQSLEISGDGTDYMFSVLPFLLEREETRNEWSISGGCSILFDVP